MIKTIAMIKRKPGTTREAFIRYYEDVHAPLAARHFDFARYVRNYPVPAPDGTEPPFDAIVEYGFEDEAAQARALAFNASPDAAILRKDEARFMDTSRTVGFLVDERITRFENDGAP